MSCFLVLLLLPLLMRRAIINTVSGIAEPVAAPAAQGAGVMKRFLWLIGGLMAVGWVGELRAQIVVVPVYSGGYGSGFGFEYRSKRVKVTVFSGGYYSDYGPGPYGPGYSSYGPGGPFQKNVIINVYTPQTIVTAPPQSYDLTGVDLDLVRPDKSAGKSEIGPKPSPPSPAPGPELPGKDVSVPKKAIRPEDKIDEVKPKPPAPVFEKPAEFPKPVAPLAIPRDESNRLMELGLEEFKLKNFGQAAQHFRAATKVDPSNFLAWLLLAQADFAFARFGQSVEAIQMAMKLQKNYPNVSFRPRLSLYKGIEPEFDDQLALLAEAVKDNPKSHQLLFLLAHQLWFDNQRDSAVEIFQRARLVAPDPTFIDIFLNAAKPKVIVAK
jgi:hypothetical protein